ncbi:hypothetical protein Esti_003896 [Eimeria stiedai]
MRSSPGTMLRQLNLLHKPIRLHPCPRSGQNVETQLFSPRASAGVSSASSDVDAKYLSWCSAAARSFVCSLHQINLIKKRNFSSEVITCLVTPPRKLELCICNGSARAASTRASSSPSFRLKEPAERPGVKQLGGRSPQRQLPEEDSNATCSKSRGSSIWDASYAVKDESTGSDIFVEFSVESVRQALRKKAARGGGAYRLDEFLEERGHESRGGESSSKERKTSTSPTARRKRRIRVDAFEALPDEQFANLIPDELSIQQLLYVLGRASVLANPTKNGWIFTEPSAVDHLLLPPDKWAALFETLHSRIDQLEPLEITRACQALAYSMQAINRAASDSDAASSSGCWKAAQTACSEAFEKLQRATATRIHELHGDCLSRVFYASLKGGFPENAGFVEFACAEVVGRLDSLRPWHVFRVFQSSVHSKTVSPDFIRSIAIHLVKRLAYLPADSIGALVSSCVQLGIFNSPSHLAKLNIIAGKRFRGLPACNLLIRLGEPLLSHSLLTPVALLKGLMRTAAPAEYPAVENANTYLESIHDTNKCLLPLKLMEMCIRHDCAELYKALGPSIQSWLEKVRATQVQLTCFAPPLEQQHVNASLFNFLTTSYHLHPSLYGPFLLELSDPLSRVAVEWDTPWLLYPPWKQFKQQVYAQQKHRYLKAEGWKVILLPLQTCLDQDGALTKEKCLIDAARKLLPEYLHRK